MPPGEECPAGTSTGPSGDTSSTWEEPGGQAGLLGTYVGSSVCAPPGFTGGRPGWELSVWEWGTGGLVRAPSSADEQQMLKQDRHLGRRRLGIVCIAQLPHLTISKN